MSSSNSSSYSSSEDIYCPHCKNLDGGDADKYLYDIGLLTLLKSAKGGCRTCYLLVTGLRLAVEWPEDEDTWIEIQMDLQMNEDYPLEVKLYHTSVSGTDVEFYLTPGM
jgi:hypothetical protein